MKNKKKITLQQVFAVATAITIMFVFAACDNGTKDNNGTKPDPKCECPTGTVHAPETPCNCGKAECNCSVFSREFTGPNLALFGKPITLKDVTGGATSLEARGIKSKVEASLIVFGGEVGGLEGKFNDAYALAGNKFVVEIRNSNMPARGYAFVGNTIYLHEDLFEHSATIVGEIMAEAFIYDRDLAKANSKDNVRVAKASELVPVTKC